MASWAAPGVRAGGRLFPHLALAAGVLLLTALFAGHLLGVSRPNVSVLTGVAYSADAISVTVDDVTYAIPKDVRWLDAEGSWHTGGRPECLPPTAVDVPVTFGTVAVDAPTFMGYAVVWVSCPKPE